MKHIPKLTFFRYLWVRIAISMLLIFSISLFLLFYVVLSTGENYLEEQLKSRIDDEVRFLTFEFLEDGVEELLEEIDERIEKNSGSGRFLYVVQKQDKILFDPYPRPQALQEWHERVDESTSQSLLFKYVELRSEVILGVGHTRESLDQFAAALKRAFLWVVLPVAILGGLVGVIFGQFFSARLRRIFLFLNGISQGDFSRTLPESNNGDEFSLLSAQLNEMQRRIQNLLQSVAYLSSGIAHDLRTPLAKLQHEIEQMARLQPANETSLDRLQQHIDQLNGYIASLLFLAEVQSGRLKSSFVECSCAAIISDIHDSYEPALDDLGLSLVLTVDNHHPVLGNPSLLVRLFANLFDNLSQYADPQFPVSIELQEQSQALHIRCENHVLEMGDKLVESSERESTPTSYSSKGLGMKIMEAIVQLHDGHMSYHQDSRFHLHIRIPLVHSKRHLP